MKQSFPPKKPLISYYLIALIALTLVNTLIMPSLIKKQMKEVPYSTFLTMMNEGHIKEAALDDKQIGFVSRDETDKTLYVTGRIQEDTGLVDRMLAAGVTFTKEIPQESSPILDFLLSWIVPVILFLALGQWLMRQMGKRVGGGGGVMSFGKSNAKVYVQAQTGKSFKDVAGQEEAKEALTEIVDFLHHPERYSKIGAQLPKVCSW